jgi:beta-glucosidase
MGRIVTGGRIWENFGSDPYHSGQLAASNIRGIQSQGVIATPKHFLGNEQETMRKPSYRTDGERLEPVSSNIDDKTLHELYLWPFVDAIHAGAGSILSSYNRLNNSNACQNSKLQNGILKTELGFQGFCMCDWHGQYTGYFGAESGLDMSMPEPYGYWGSRLTEAVRNGSFEETRLNDMVTRYVI